MGYSVSDGADLAAFEAGWNPLHIAPEGSIAAFDHIEDAKVGDDPVHHALAGQRQGALLQNLRLALLVL
jgi:hypothetical protein